MSTPRRFWTVRAPASGTIYWVVVEVPQEQAAAQVAELVRATSIYRAGEQHPMQAREIEEVPGAVREVEAEGVYDEQGRSVG